MKSYALVLAFLTLVCNMGPVRAADPLAATPPPTAAEQAARLRFPWLNPNYLPYATPWELGADGRFNRPYFGLLSDPGRTGVSFAAGGNSRLRFGTLEVDPHGASFNDHGKRFLSSAEFEQKLGRAVGIISVGVLRDVGAMVGSEHGLAMALNARPTTTFTALSAGFALTPTSSLVAMASYGRTAGFGTADSLLSQVSEVRTAAYSIGYSRSNLWRDNDRFGLTFSIPAKVRSGSLLLGGAVAQLPDAGALGFGGQTLNLRPTATERDLEMSYTTLFGRDGRLGKFSTGMMWRVNPGHDATAKPEWLIGVRYTRGF